ncbi:3-deoxy-D-manno-octulosonic acid transferase [Caulobacter sp. KR2-114]|uniref:3-deoxy-D-manno-octulosonic acid transferase n=1 Tax=Caulobacter sp. KR2-114 TaxID=3400912 RepID=UPI003C05B0FF
MSDRPFSLALYRAATTLAAPAAGLLLRARVRRGKEDPARLGERLGRPGLDRPPGPLAWIHAVSVGEAISALALVDGLRARRADISLLVTTGTRTAGEVVAARLPPGAMHQYAPMDTPGAVRRFLAHWRPELGLFVESELWPNLILGARQAGVRLALVSARVSEASAARWRKAPAAARRLLGAFDLVLAQDEATAARLAAIGRPVDGRLNLKDAGEPLPADDAALAALRAATAGRFVLLAASTHAGEEAIVADAVDRLPAPRPLLIIVPRHPARADAIAAALAPRRIARRSHGQTPGAETDVYLADTLGELGLFYRLADLAVVGGSLVPGVGGHNPLEPARLGLAIVSGPHIGNFQALYDGLAAAGGVAITGETAGEPGRTLAALVGDETARRALAAEALAFATARRAALAESWAALEPFVAAT